MEAIAKQLTKSGEFTSIQVTHKLRDRLKALGRKGDSYADVVSMLIDHYEKTQKK